MIYTSGREHKEKATQLFRFLISAIQFVNSISEQNKLIIVKKISTIYQNNMMF